MPHPVEGLSLKREGFTWDKANKEERLVGVVFEHCEKCGTVNCRYSPLKSHSCVPDLLIIVVLISLSVVYVPTDLPLRFLTGMSAYFFYLLGKGYIEKLRPIPVDIRLPQLTNCSTCGHSQFEKMHTGKPVICPQCLKRTLVYECTART